MAPRTARLPRLPRLRRSALLRASRVVTPLGRSVLLLGLVSYALARGGDWPAMRLLWIGCLLLWVLALIIWAVPAAMRARLRLDPPRAVAGESSGIEVELRAAGPFPVLRPLISLAAGRVPLVARAPTLRPNRTHREDFTIVNLRRGVLTVGPVIQHRSDPVGLLQWDRERAPAAELLVLPRTVRIAAVGGGAIRDQEGRTSDEISMSDLAFHALREYVPGDDLRHVHWRSSARADSLQVRQYLDSRRSHMTVVIDDEAGSYRDPEDFETAVSVAASLAVRADSDGVDVSMLCGDVAISGRGLEAVMDACCRIQPGEGDPVQAVHRAMRLAPHTSTLTLVTGGGSLGGLLGAVRGGLPPSVHLVLVRADRGSPSGLSNAPSTQVVGIAELDDLPKLVEGMSR